MESVRIPISGIDTQVDEYSPRDGSCQQIDKFRPVGRVDDPRWEVIPAMDEYSFANKPGDLIKILGLHYSLGKWYVACMTGTGTPGSNRLMVYEASESGGVITFGTNIISVTDAFSLDITLSSEVYFQDFGPEKFYMLFSPGVDDVEGQHQLWEITEDGATPNVFRPELHLVQTTVNTVSLTTTNFNTLYPAAAQSTGPAKGGLFLRLGQMSRDQLQLSKLRAQGAIPREGEMIVGGTYPGILKNQDKFFGVITAFKHPNGQWVKHSQPHVFEVPIQSSGIGTNTEYATLSFGKNPNYVDNSSNYGDNVGNNFTLYGHSTQANEWKQLGEVGVFLTSPKNTRSEAYLEGTYYLIGTLNDDDELDWAENEELIVTGEVLNQDPLSHHIITGKTINSYGNGLALIRSVTNFSLPGVEWHNQIVENFGSGNSIHPKINETPPVGVDYNESSAVRVTIETSKGTFYRWNTINIPYGDLGGGNFLIYISEFNSYPDREATKLDFYWYDSSSGEHELAISLLLKPHPFLNLAYIFDPDASNGFYSVAYSVGTTEVLDFSTDNAQMYVEEDEFKISDLSRTFFPLEWSYKIKDKIRAIIDNTNDMGDQFGQYPLYVFGEKSIYGARSGDDVLIANFDLISDNHGLNGFKSYAPFKGVLFFVSSNGIHILSGVQIEDIYDQVEGLNLYFLSSNPTSRLPEFSGLATNAPLSLFENLLSGAEVMVHHKTREILFSGTGGLLIFNEKYKQWYTYSVNGEGNPSTPYDYASYNQLIKAGDDVHIFEVPYDTGAPIVLPWNTGTSSGFFSVITNPIVMNDFSIMKRIKRMILKGKVTINGAGTDSDAGLYALNVVLQGKRSTNTSDPNAPSQDDDSWQTLISITDDTAQTITSKYLKTNYGSFQAYRLLIYGENLAAGSFISDIVSTFQSRGRPVI